MTFTHDKARNTVQQKDRHTAMNKKRRDGQTRQTLKTTKPCQLM